MKRTKILRCIPSIVIIALKCRHNTGYSQIIDSLPSTMSIHTWYIGRYHYVCCTYVANNVVAFELLLNIVQHGTE